MKKLLPFVVIISLIVSLFIACDGNVNKQMFESQKENKFESYLSILDANNAVTKTYSLSVTDNSIGITVNGNEVSYTNLSGVARKVLIHTTPNQNLTINAPNDDVTHTGKANNVNIIAVADHSYHGKAQIKLSIVVALGNIELEVPVPEVKVEASGNVSVSLGKDAKIEKLSLKTKEGSELKNIQISGEGSVEKLETKTPVTIKTQVYSVEVKSEEVSITLAGEAKVSEIKVDTTVKFTGQNKLKIDIQGEAKIESFVDLDEENSDVKNESTHKDEHIHNFDTILENTPATCTTEGSVLRSCSCKEQKKEILQPLGHDLIHHEAKQPTYKEIGWKAYDTCSRCDYTTYEELPILKHSWDDKSTLILKSIAYASDVFSLGTEAIINDLCSDVEYYYEHLYGKRFFQDNEIISNIFKDSNNVFAVTCRDVSRLGNLYSGDIAFVKSDDYIYEIFDLTVKTIGDVVESVIGGIRIGDTSLILERMLINDIEIDVENANAIIQRAADFEKKDLSMDSLSQKAVYYLHTITKCFGNLDQRSSETFIPVFDLDEGSGDDSGLLFKGAIYSTISDFPSVLNQHDTEIEVYNFDVTFEIANTQTTIQGSSVEISEFTGLFAGGNVVPIYNVVGQYIINMTIDGVEVDTNLVNYYLAFYNQCINSINPLLTDLVQGNVKIDSCEVSNGSVALSEDAKFTYASGNEITVFKEGTGITEGAFCISGSIGSIDPVDLFTFKLGEGSGTYNGVTKTSDELSEIFDTIFENPEDYMTETSLDLTISNFNAELKAGEKLTITVDSPSLTVTLEANEENMSYNINGQLSLILDNAQDKVTLDVTLGMEKDNVDMADFAMDTLTWENLVNLCGISNFEATMTVNNQVYNSEDVKNIVSFFLTTMFATGTITF